MSSNKKAKSKYSFIIICIIGFVVSIFFEFYFISYFPYDYFMLFGTGIIMCIFGYLSIDGVLEIINQTSKKRDEQNEIMIKASKAIYLTTKKIALNGSSSISDTLEPPKNISSLIDDLSQANERLAKEVENAVSLQSLVQKNRSIVNNAREIIEDHAQPLSPLEVEKDLKLDEAISETDFETVTRPETIDSMIRQEVAIQETAIQAADSTAIQKEYEVETPMTADILEETIDAVGSIMEETEKTEKTPEPLLDTSASKASSPLSDAIAASETVSDSQPESEASSETISDIFSEVKEAASSVLNGFAEYNKTAESNINAEYNEAEKGDITAENSETPENNTAAEYNETAESRNIMENITEKESKTVQNNIDAESDAAVVEKSETMQNNIDVESDAAVEKSEAVQNNIEVESNAAAEKSEAVQNNIEMKYNDATEGDINTENGKTANSNTAAESNLANPINPVPETQNTFSTSSSKTPAADSTASDKPMTSEEIAALFANL